MRSRLKFGVVETTHHQHIMKRRQFIITLAGSAAAGLTGWQLTRLGGSPNLVKSTRTGWALGTNVSLTVFHEDRQAAETALTAAFKELDRVEDLMSLYRGDSELSRLNRAGRLDNPHPDLVAVLERATTLSATTDGAFDITVQPLWEVHYRHSQAGTRPDEAEVREALSKVGWQRVQVGADRIRLQGQGTAITLNGIAQGFAADQVGKVLAGHGIQHALVDTGEIGTIGNHARKDAWSVGIKHPRANDQLLCLAALKGRCLATSGDYETRFSNDFSQHHLLDPRTGYSPTELSSVSVVAATALEADALSTAVFLLGQGAGRQLIESMDGVEALFVTKDGNRSRTSGFPVIS